MNILFTCAGRRTYLLNYFKKELQGNGLIIGADMQSTAPALSAADIKVCVPSVYDSNYVDSILSICSKYNVNLIIPLNDLELPILSENRYLFESKHIITLVSSKDVIDICFDKFKTYQYVSSLGLKSPKSYIRIEDALNAVSNGDLSYPLILKPRWGSGSIGIETVYDADELYVVYAFLKKKLERTILSTISRTDTNNILIQQKILGDEFGIDVMNDLNGCCAGVSVKKKLAMRAGETDKAVIVDCPEISKIGSILGTKLHHFGNLDCDIIEENGCYYVLELNPRFGGGFPFSYESGVNYPKALISWVNNQSIDTINLKPIVGKVFAKCDYLVDVTD